MFFSGILSLIWSFIIYILGLILAKSEQLRLFLGIKTDEYSKNQYADVTFWVELMGKLLMAYAVIMMIQSIISIIVSF